MRARFLVLISSAAIVAAVAFVAGSAPLEAQRAFAAPCEPARAHAPGDSDGTIESGGMTREYILHVPASYTGTEPVPVVFLLHGLGEGATHIMAYSEMFQVADSEGFLLVAPWALERPPIAAVRWGFLGIEGPPDDVLFISDLIDSLTSELCVDTSRVYAAGISNGAMMSTRLACDLSDRIAAFGIVAGLYYPPWSPQDIPNEVPCSGTRPVPIVAFHGTADDIVPYAGGEIGLGFGLHIRNVETEVLPDWAEHNSCTEGPLTEPVTAHVNLIHYDNCADGATVSLYSIEGGNHVWPGATDEPAPDIDDEVSANTVLWDFFQSQTLPAVQEPAPTATSGPAVATATPALVLPSTGSGGALSGLPPFVALVALFGATAVLGTGAALLRRRPSN